MKQIYTDLWQTEAEQPNPRFPDLVTRACLITRDGGNVLLYSTGRDEELDQIEKLGGVRWQYLSHVDEAGPALGRIKQRFGSALCVNRLEAEAIREASGIEPDVLFESREAHPSGLEVVPAPGHTPGSTCFLYESPHGKTYLFTGDTLGRAKDGSWTNGYLAGISDKQQLIETLHLLAVLSPDVVISSAWGKHYALNEVSPQMWSSAIKEALAPLVTDARESVADKTR